MRIKDLLAKNFSVLSDSLSPCEASSLLTEGRMGVVVDRNGTPHSLVTADDLRLTARLGARSLREPGVKLPGTLVVRYESDCSELSPEQLSWLNEAGSRGVVVLDEKDGVTGVVTIVSVLHSMAAEPAGLSMVNMATTLTGDPNTGPPGLACGECGFVNITHYHDDNRPQDCQNEEWTSHKFKFRR